MCIASIISVVIESVKTIAIEKITNVEIKVYISKKTCKTEHIISTWFICLLKRLWIKYVQSIWHIDERLLILKVIKSWGFSNSKSLAWSKIRPTKNTMEEGVFYLHSYLFFFFFAINYLALFCMLIEVSWGSLLWNSTKIKN